jgi:F-type H+-transporting ATPase subunit gamma
MANILDIRRRIRSVVNTRQITKAMKTVSAAKLRRAQEAAMAARPYSQMLTNVLKSLVERAEIYDPATGLPIHPLLAERPERNILLIVVTGDKGLAGAFNTNILKMASKFIQSSPSRISISNVSEEKAAISCGDVIRWRRNGAMRLAKTARKITERQARRPSAPRLWCRSARGECRLSANTWAFWARLSLVLRTR